MIMRCLDLCNAQLRGDWKSFPHQFLVLLDNQIQLLTAFGTGDFSSAEAAVRPGLRGRVLPSVDGSPLVHTFSHATDIFIQSPDPRLLTGDSLLLKRQLCVALDVELGLLETVLSRNKYILTFDVSCGWGCVFCLVV